MATEQAENLSGTVLDPVAALVDKAASGKVEDQVDGARDGADKAIGAEQYATAVPPTTAMRAGGVSQAPSPMRQLVPFQELQSRAAYADVMSNRADAPTAGTRVRDRIILTLGATTLGAGLLAFSGYCIACAHPAVVYPG